MVRLLTATGWTARSPERSVWFVADSVDRLAAAAGFVEALQAGGGRLNFYGTANDGRTAALATLAPLAPVPPPLAIRPFLNLTLRRLRVRAVVSLGPETRLARALTRAAADMGMAAVAWSGEGAAPADLADRLMAAVRTNPRRKRWAPWADVVARRALDGGLPLGVEKLRLRKVNDLAALRTALGAPRTILCLGSGPSSNAPEALAMADGADAIFRVKHRWLAEGRIKRADAVFTGTAETAAKLPHPIMLVQDAASAARLVFERAWRGGLTPLRLGVVEALVAGYRAETPTGARMTNGAAMLATAVALAPARLCVAGVDLYSHPAGAYPGAPDGQNAYAPAHDQRAERDFALAMLARQLERRGPDGLRVAGPLAEIARNAGLPIPETMEVRTCPSSSSAA